MSVPLRFDYHRPATLVEALQLAADLESAVFIAGGTDLLVRMKSGLTGARHLISLRRLDELRGVEVDEQGVTIGAAATLADLQAHATLSERCGVLTQAIGTMASEQIRNTATLGGNLCRASPCADGGPPLIALGARVRLVGPQGEREVEVESFFTGPGQTSLRPGEALAAIRIDMPAPVACGVYLKSGRVRVDLAFASLAAQLELEEDGETCKQVRLAAGAVSPTPVRLHAAEALLVGARVAGAGIQRDALEEAAELARQAIVPISDIRASASHRRHITGVLARRAVEQAAVAAAAAGAGAKRGGRS